MAAGATLIIWNARNATNEPLKPTIALLPFTTASPDPELRQIASQARDSIAHTFSESGVPLRLLSAPPKDGRPAVDFMFSGDVSRKGDTVLATVRLDEAAHGVTVFSHQFEAGREDLRDLPERIGAQMAGNLTWNFPMMLLDRRRPLDPAILTELMQDMDFTKGLGGLQIYQMSKRVAAKAPDFHVTQSSLAFNTAFTLVDLPREERAEAVAEARRASDRVVALAPNFGDSYSPWCLLRSETLWAACEDRLRAARRIDPDAPFLNTFLSHLLRNVGRFEESMDLAKLAHTHDVYVPTKIAWMLKTLETEGESDAAQEQYQQAARWWPEYKPMFFRNRLYGLIGRGDFEAIPQLERDLGVANFMPDYQDSRAIVAALKSRSLPAARNACPNTDDWFVMLRCMIVLASLGDQDGSYAIANKIYPRRLGRTAVETERIWLEQPEFANPEFITSPAAAPMRRDPRYLQVAERTGLLAYWRTGRRPDFCRKDPEPICAQLLKRN
jgi:TolB-like protein